MLAIFGAAANVLRTVSMAFCVVDSHRSYLYASSDIVIVQLQLVTIMTPKAITH